MRDVIQPCWNDRRSRRVFLLWRVKRERAPIAINRLDCAALCEQACVVDWMLAVA